MLKDLFGYFERNISKMNKYEKEKTVKELTKILNLFNNEVKSA